MTISRYPVYIKDKYDNYQITSTTLDLLNISTEPEGYKDILSQYPPLTQDWLRNQLEIMAAPTPLDVHKFINNIHYILLDKMYRLNLAK